MKTETEIIIDIVSELNQEFYDKTLITELDPFILLATGNSWLVQTGDYPLLSSEDGGLWDEDGKLVDVKAIIKTKFNEYVDMLHKGRFE